MMPKSTATSLRSSSTNRLPGCMSAWKKPSRSAWRRKVWITARPSALRSKPLASSRARSDSGVASIHSSVSTSRAVRFQSTLGTRKSGSCLGVLRHLGQRGGLQPQIHLDGDGAPQRLDHLDETQPPRLGRQVLGVARHEREGGEIDLAAMLDAGPQHFHRDRLCTVGGRDLGAVNLRDRGGRDRRAEDRERFGQRALERGLDHALGFRLRERRHLVLQGFQVARQHDPDHVRPRRQELAELHIGGSEPGQGRGQTIARDRARGPLDEARRPQRETRGRRHLRRIDQTRARPRGRTPGPRARAGPDGQSQ